MAQPSFLGSSNGGGPTPEVGPNSNPEYTDGAAPGGPWAPTSITPTPNPLGDSSGSPSTTGGFRPTSDGPSLPALGPAGVDYPKPVGR